MGIEKFILLVKWIFHGQKESYLYVWIFLQLSSSHAYVEIFLSYAYVLNDSIGKKVWMPNANWRPVKCFDSWQIELYDIILDVVLYCKKIK